MQNNWQSKIVVIFSLLSPTIWAADSQIERGKIPDEYESVGDHALGLNNAGMAATGGMAAVKMNPAMLPMESTYSVSAGYHWPTSGRDFFQLGVVDSKTSPIAAGFVYTSFRERYDPTDPTKHYEFDSPVVRRASLGFGQTFKVLALGIGGQFVEAQPVGHPEADSTNGTSLAIGAAALVTPVLRVGVSAENLANNKIADYAPRTVRIGTAWMLMSGDLTLHLDARNRERVLALEGPLNTSGFDVNDQADDELRLEPENTVIGSFSARIYDLIRLLGAYSQDVGEEKRSLSGGIAVVGQQMTLSYTATRPDMRDEQSHQAINLSVRVSM